jgi:glycerophosphoryl diester phosphodiesterase
VIEQLHRAGLPVLTWTVDDLPTMRALRRVGVDGITSNRPDLLAQLR